MKTKDKILQKALDLFNENGVLNVSLRQIAAAVYISQGNLNYHYRHREDIIETLFDLFNEEIDGIDLVSEDKANLLSHFIDTNKREMEILYKYRFLVVDFNQNMKENPRLLQKQLTKEDSQNSKFLKFIREAIDEGIVRGPAFDKEYQGLYERFNIFKIYWISSIEAKRKPNEEDVVNYHNLLVEMIFPYLSRESQREFLLKRF
jgi:AcrR family transcriptional regulator